jgi:hypothetical protein
MTTFPKSTSVSVSFESGLIQTNVVKMKKNRPIAAANIKREPLVELNIDINNLISNYRVVIIQ